MSKIEEVMDPEGRIGRGTGRRGGHREREREKGQDEQRGRERWGGGQRGRYTQGQMESKSGDITYGVNNTGAATPRWRAKMYHM